MKQADADAATGSRPRGRWWDRAIAAGLFVLSVGWLLSVEGRQGIGRDEAQYFRAAERYWGWYEQLGANLKAGRLGDSFSAAGVQRFWNDNPEHPVVMKTLYAFSWRLFHRCECVKEAAWHFAPVTKHTTIPLFARESTAFRFPAMLMAGLGVVLVFLLAGRWLGRGSAAVAGVLALAQPHYFFHAQIAAFDAPITVMAVAVGYCYWRSLRAPRWAIIGGLVFGVALGVKHNAWLMPIFLAGHYLWLRRQDLLGAGRRRLPPVPAVFLAMAVLGPIVFFLHWPKVWSDPVGHSRWYVRRHVQHEHYNFEYLGRNWNNPPKEWDRKLVRATFPFVSTALTVPATTLALALLGGVLLVRRARRLRRDEGDDLLSSEPAPPPAAGRATWLRPGADVDLAPGAFLFVQIAGPLAVLAVPSTPIFGGVKHFMPAMPYLAIVAAVGLHWLHQFLREQLAAVPARGSLTRFAQRSAPAALSALVCVPALVETRRSHPDGLSHYNFLAGGFAGGASLGMNRQFWGYSVLPILDQFARDVPRSRNTYWHDVLPDALNFYVRDGRIPSGLGNVGTDPESIPRSDIGLLFHERHFGLFEALFWESYGSTRTHQVRTREGVPIVIVYRRWDLPK